MSNLIYSVVMILLASLNIPGALNGNHFSYAAIGFIIGMMVCTLINSWMNN